MNPIEHLRQEHRDIMAQIADLRAVVRDLTLNGEAALPEALPVLRRIGQLTETQLAHHALKEDEALFPAVEAVLGADGSPTTVMRVEHTDIHAQAALLRSLLAQGGGAPSLRASADELIALLDLHFDKEEQVLFPMIEEMLDADTLAEVGHKIETLA